MTASATYRGDLRYPISAGLLPRGEAGTEDVEALLDRPVSKLSMNDLEALCDLGGIRPPEPADYRRSPKR